MYALVWRHLALEALADVYVNLSLADQDRLAAEVEALNNRLRSNPDGEGESRAGGFRITFIYKLAVVFHVSAIDRIVHVIWVKHFGA